MTDPINLRRARKAKARIQTDKIAAQNRVTFGTSKVAKSLNKARSDLASRQLDSLRRTQEGDDAPD
jgi:Domain of unknown function (DUF4169)